MGHIVDLESKVDDNRVKRLIRLIVEQSKYDSQLRVYALKFSPQFLERIWEDFGCSD